MIDKITDPLLELVGDDKAMVIVAMTILGTVCVLKFGMEAKDLIGMIITGFCGFVMGDKRGNNKRP